MKPQTGTQNKLKPPNRQTIKDPLLRTISNFRIPRQSLSTSEMEVEPCQRREEIEKMYSDDSLTEHQYQQLDSVHSCEIRSLKRDDYETYPETTETTETYGTLLAFGVPHYQFQGAQALPPATFKPRGTHD